MVKKLFCLVSLAAAVLISASVSASENCMEPSYTGRQKLIPYGAVSADGYFKGIRLAGKVKVVSSFPDIKVQVVHSFPDLKVKVVDNFPDKIGEWKFVDNFPDFTIQFVNSFPDIKIQFVDYFPGV